MMMMIKKKNMMMGWCNRRCIPKLITTCTVCDKNLEHIFFILLGIRVCFLFLIFGFSIFVAADTTTNPSSNVVISGNVAFINTLFICPVSLLTCFKRALPVLLRLFPFLMVITTDLVACLLMICMVMIQGHSNNPMAMGENILVFWAMTIFSICFKLLHLSVTLKLLERHRLEKEEEEEEEEEKEEDSGYGGEVGGKKSQIEF